MARYGKPQTFTLDYAQMGLLLDRIDSLFKGADGNELQDAKRWEPLRALRNELHRHLD